jgi:hypothetical protein
MLIGLNNPLLQNAHGPDNLFFRSNYPVLLVTNNSKASQVQVWLMDGRVYIWKEWMIE